jgi:hypothetical protein
LFAVVLFFRALRYFGASPWQAFAAGTGVLWSVFHDPSLHDVVSDSLAISMAVVTVSLLLFVSATPRRPGPWIGVTLCLALTYHIRPAYLFLIPLVPCLGLLFRAIHARWHHEPLLWRRYAAALLATAILPFLTFCALRLAVVGHFGLVSFGGWNIVGIAVEMLDRPLIDAHVPEDLRVTALDILQARDRAHGRHGLTGALREGRLSVGELNKNYNVNVWEVAAPVFLGRYPEAKTAEGKFCSTAINRDLTRLSLSVIRARKSAYLGFFVRNYLMGLGESLGLGEIRYANLTWVCFTLAAVSLHVLRILVWPRGLHAPLADDRARCYTMQLMLVLGILFTVTGLPLVAMVEPAMSRYVCPLTVFLPSISVLWVLQEFQQIAAELRSGEA